ncbi:hypothetical protein SBRCBS47491_001938 [Sporothrix bragantina]|uniref:GH16 domain-containing protein n=1 Tax=Sporothrix bragantina TaxID=671064 RepID=A0ABP0B2Q9_9PEZI
MMSSLRVVEAAILLLASSAPLAEAALTPNVSSTPPALSSPSYRYLLTQNYLPHNLTDGFVFKTAADYPGTGDPTRGFVDYVDLATATADGLVQLIPGSADQGAPFSATRRRHEQLYLGVDHSTVITPSSSSGNASAPYGNATAPLKSTSLSGRRSLRLESRATFSRGLLVTDLAHMPAGQCGVWPALWTYNFREDPPGEIDIIEGVNHQAVNMVSLHTGGTCSFSASTEENGLFHRDDCNVVYGNVSTYGGCGVTAPTTDTYGTGFNAAGGGVYATLLEDERLRVWHWARANVPADLQQGRPDPTTWGPALADFRQANGGCDVAANFHSLTVILNTDFCGINESDTMWSSDPACAAYPSCEAFVASQPEAFNETYWLVNSIRVYEPGEVVTPVIPTNATTTTSAATTTWPTAPPVSVNVTQPAPIYTNTTTSSTKSQSVTLVNSTSSLTTKTVPVPVPTTNSTTTRTTTRTSIQTSTRASTWTSTRTTQTPVKPTNPTSPHPTAPSSSATTTVSQPAAPYPITNSTTATHSTSNNDVDNAQLGLGPSHQLAIVFVVVIVLLLVSDFDPSTLLNVDNFNFDKTLDIVIDVDLELDLHSPSPIDVVIVYGSLILIVVNLDSDFHSPTIVYDSVDIANFNAILEYNGPDFFHSTPLIDVSELDLHVLVVHAVIFVHTYPNVTHNVQDDDNSADEDDVDQPDTLEPSKTPFWPWPPFWPEPSETPGPENPAPGQPTGSPVPEEPGPEVPSPEDGLPPPWPKWPHWPAWPLHPHGFGFGPRPWHHPWKPWNNPWNKPWWHHRHHKHHKHHHEDDDHDDDGDDDDDGSWDDSWDGNDDDDDRDWRDDSWKDDRDRDE